MSANRSQVANSTTRGNVSKRSWLPPDLSRLEPDARW